MRVEYLIALFVALIWSAAPIVMIGYVRHHGALLLNAIRIVFTAGIFLSISVVLGDFRDLSSEAAWSAVISGIVGVLIGDGFLYVGLRLLGPRRNTLIFSSNIFFSILLGVLFLGEVYLPIIWLGVALLVIGMFFAILYAPSRSGRTKTGSLAGDDDVLGEIGIGVGAGLIAAFCQAYGLFVLAPHLKDGGDPTVFTAIRLAAAAMLCLPYLAYAYSRGNMPNLKEIFVIALVGLFAMGVGSYLLQYALKTAELGIINMLSATSPIWVLPLLWWRTGAMPHWMAWVGALLGVWGLSFVFLPEYYLMLFGHGTTL